MTYDELKQLAYKLIDNPTESDKKKLKKLLKDVDNDKLMDALIEVQIESRGISPNTLCEPNSEERIAMIYYDLAEFVAQKAKIDNRVVFKAELDNGLIKIYAVTPSSSVELDFYKYILSENPDEKESLYTIDAYFSDCSIELKGDPQADQKLDAIKCKVVECFNAIALR